MKNLLNIETLKLYQPIYPFFYKNRKILLWGSIFVIMSSAISIISPYILKIAIDDLRANISIKKLGAYSFLIVFITFFHGIFRYKMRKILISLSRFFEYELHNQIYKHILNLPQRFFNKVHTGDVMSKITNDVHAVRMAVGPAFMYTLNTIFTSIFAISMMISINPLLTLLTLLPLPIMSFSGAKIGKKIRQYFSKVQKTFGDLSIKTQESVSGIREIKAFTREKCEINEFNKLNEVYLNYNKKLIKAYAIMHPLFFFIIGLSILIILCIGGKFVIDKKISLGSFVAFYSYLFLLAWPAIAIGWIINLIQRGTASMKRIKELLDEVPVNKSAGKPLKTKKYQQQEQASLHIKNLSFKYNHNLVLKNINIIINSNQITAITGSTASGKSTLLKQILRRDELQSGFISFNDININEISLIDWLELISYVPQDPILFSNTIENNITLGTSNSISTDYINECLKIACIDDEIAKMPHGIKTIIGERGITLSGGQKQRISLARALAKKPLILLLDDPFSQIDIDTEFRIWNNLTKFQYSPIKVIVSQRINSIQNADIIYVLDNGNIIEYGGHQSLVANKSVYYQLLQKQIIEQKIKT